MKLSNKLYTKYITKFVELTTNNEKTELPETKVFVDYDSLWIIWKVWKFRLY